MLHTFLPLLDLREPRVGDSTQVGRVMTPGSILETGQGFHTNGIKAVVTQKQYTHSDLK